MLHADLKWKGSIVWANMHSSMKHNYLTKAACQWQQQNMRDIDAHSYMKNNILYD